MHRHSDQPLRIIFLLPVFNDWASFAVLLGRLDAACSSCGVAGRILAVDDGSTESRAIELGATSRPALDRVEVLTLRRNVGHQRAIALGLSFIEAERDGDLDAVVVMDTDGEDRPEDVPALVERFRARGGDRVVFAKRSKRLEGFVFRVCYRAYQVLHRALTGIRVEVGNFSITPAHKLGALTAMPELWNHFAASVFKSRIPFESVGIERGTRIAGRSHMNFVDLVVHGLSAVSVFSETVAVRVLIAVGSIAAGSIALLVVGALLALFGAWPSLPDWTGWGAFVVAVVALQLLGITASFVIQVLNARNDLGFLPARDYRYFVAGIETLEATDAGTVVRR